MKIKSPVTKQTALIAALILGSTAWLSADTNRLQYGQPDSAAVRRSGTTTADGSATSQAAQPMKINKGSSLIGATVKNQQGETLGKIRDVVIDLSSEKVAYAVLDSGSLIGPQKLHAVPLRAFQVDTEGKSLILNADKEKLAQSQGFDKDNWPAMNDSAWGAESFWKDTQGTSGSHEGKDATTDSKKSEPQSQP